MLNGVETDEDMENLIAEQPADKIKPGVRFCLHDLRRTFASVAESVVSYSVLKRLMNHFDKNVTQGYIVLSVDKLGLPMQLIWYKAIIMSPCHRRRRYLVTNENDPQDI